MTTLSIFNNGSKAWVVLLLFGIIFLWFAYNAYKTHKSGYKYKNADGTEVILPTKLKYLFTPSMNGDAFMAMLTLIGMTLMILLINADYAG